MGSEIQKTGATALDMTEHAERMQARSELIRKTVCPKGISEDEFALFIEQCKRSGLDPLLRQAHCVPRRQNIGTRESPKWVEKHEFQPSEVGMLSRAERFPDFRGVQASPVYAGDEISIDTAKGEVSHRFNPVQRKGALVGAWARLVRHGKTPIVKWLPLADYQQSSPLWGKMPGTMIEKCARVAALRAAYPEAFGGMYVEGERADDGHEVEDVTPARPVLSKPSLPAVAATRAVAPSARLERAPAPVEADVVEAAPTEPPAVASREPGADDGEEDDTPVADSGPEEWEVWVDEINSVQTREEYSRYAARAESAPKGSPERKALSAALRVAYGRLQQSNRWNTTPPSEG